MTTSDFTQLVYSGFDKKFKHVLKKYRHSFAKDFDLVMTKVILNGIATRGIDNIPKTNRIAGLGESVSYPIFKTKIYISEARDDCGRIVYLIDAERKKIFCIDVYYKSDQENHDEETIRKAHTEYVSSLNLNN